MKTKVKTGSSGQIMRVSLATGREPSQCSFSGFPSFLRVPDEVNWMRRRKEERAIDPSDLFIVLYATVTGGAVLGLLAMLDSSLTVPHDMI